MGISFLADIKQFLGVKDREQSGNSNTDSNTLQASLLADEHIDKFIVSATGSNTAELSEPSRFFKEGFAHNTSVVIKTSHHWQVEKNLVFLNTQVWKGFKQLF